MIACHHLPARPATAPAAVADAAICPTAPPHCGGLAVVSCHYNFAGYDAPRRNLLRFLREQDAAGLPVYGIELVAPGSEAATAGNRRWLRVAATPAHRLWQKEAAMNAAVAMLPPEVRQVAAVDADLRFDNADWARESAAMLATSPAVQPFSTAVWTDRRGRIWRAAPSSAAAGSCDPGRSHPGFAWVFDRAFFDGGPGLWPWCLTGGGDVVLAEALVSGEVRSAHRVGGLNLPRARAWAAEVRRWCGGDAPAAAAGQVWHEWHGSPGDRRYATRHLPLEGVAAKLHVELDADGLLRWTRAATPEMRAALVDHFEKRREDG